VLKEGCISEKIKNKLREAEILLDKGNTIGEANHRVGVTE
jgi:hypothetical protein